MQIFRFIVLLAATMIPFKAHALYYSAEKKEDNKVTTNMVSDKIPHRTIKESSPITHHNSGVQIEHTGHLQSVPQPNNSNYDVEKSLKGNSFHTRDGSSKVELFEEVWMSMIRRSGATEDMSVLTQALPIVGIPGQSSADISFTTKGGIAAEHNQLDGKARSVVEGYLTYFSKKLKTKFSQWLTHGSKYVPAMKQVLEEHNLPGDLIYLSMIESGFNLFARSPSHAVGPWQLMASTAKRLNLQVNYWVDERMDPIKSTRAASRYLRFLFDKFGSWDLAIAAYNAGENNIENALRKTNATSFWKLFASSHLTNETKQFVPKFLAASEIGQKPEKYGIDDVTTQAPFTFDVVVVVPPATLSFVAQSAGTTVEKIRELNPELRQWCIPPYMQKYRLRIPAGKRDSFLYAYNAASVGERYPLASYTTRSGDTLASIARKSRVQLDILRDLNKLSSNGVLTPNMVIYMPPNTTIVKSNDDQAKDNVRHKGKIHVKSKTRLKGKIHINAKEQKMKDKRAVKAHNNHKKSIAHNKPSHSQNKRST
ncbi:MAG: transglycosylase SLT domain-containing protein [Nitrospirae bacterium]|nr:transglycosylase SLT domain-containing protein [Nitrospirota bacterium]